MGFLCGPYVLRVFTVERVAELAYVNKIALSFIAFSAGAEMDWKEIAPLMRSVLYVSAGMTTFTMVICTIMCFLMSLTVLLPWLGMKCTHAAIIIIL